MMTSTSPPQVKKRTAQQQYSSQQQYSNNKNNNNNNRIGGNHPFRDDPSAPPSVRLESFTPGGYGPPGIDNNSHLISSDDKKKRRPWWKQSVCSATACCQLCCISPDPNVTRADNGPHSVYTQQQQIHQNGNQQHQQPHQYYYLDTFNDLSWSCSMGTSDEDGIWLNQSDPAGTIMSVLVWILIGYSTLTMVFLAKTNGIPDYWSYLYTIISALSLACHVKTTFTDPGAVPASAVPTEIQRANATRLSMCSQCQTFKPPFSHHCRICNRCISRMDHHCPWMNNCIGAGNMKHFLLFLIYTWTCSVMALLLLGYNYFFCDQESCMFHVVLVQLVRIMTFLCLASFLFTSSMLMNVVYGILTGVGTIDRLKKKATNTLHEATEEPMDLRDIFGVGPYITWFLPMDPTFSDYDVVMGFSTPQRLLREQVGGSSSESVVSAAGTNTSWSMAV